MANCVWPGPSPGDEEFVAVANIDSDTGGRLLANWVMENTEPGQIIIVQGIVGQGFSEKIDEGFDGVISSDWEVVVREQGFFDPAAAVQIVETALQAHPDASIIIDYAAVMAGGISTFLQTNGIENITHLTSDIDEPLLDWFGTPYLAGTRYFSPADLGRLPTLELRKALEGGTPTFEVGIEQLMATAENIDQVIVDIPFNHPEFDEITTKL